MDDKKECYFKLQELDKEESRQLADKLKNVKPDNILFLKIQSDGTIKGAAYDAR